jgi:antitoxin (DNA-binding transcriptional repressor) of toxin-antitoxin stability system
MTVISIQQAQERLSDLIHDLTPGDELVITENDQPVARLVRESTLPQRASRRPGILRGTVKYMAPDFDAPLDDFKEYME